MPSENCQQLDRLASVRSGLSSIYRNYDFHLSLVKMTGSVVLLSLLSASLVLTNYMYQIEKANVRNRSECITSQAPEDTQTQSNNTLCSYLKPFQLPGEYFVTVCLYQKIVRLDFRKFLNGKPTIQGLYLDVNQWNYLKRLQNHIDTSIEFAWKRNI